VGFGCNDQYRHHPYSRIEGQSRSRICMFCRLTSIKSGLDLVALTTPLILPQNCVALAMVNPLAGPDHEVAGWFHGHLTRTFVSVLRAFTDCGSGSGMGAVFFFVLLYFVWNNLLPT